MRASARGFARVRGDEFAEGVAGGIIKLVPRVWLKECTVVATSAEELTVFVVDPGKTACHSSAKVDPGASENNRKASGHVFAGVIAYTFHDRESSGVAHGKALACAARCKQ